MQVSLLCLQLRRSRPVVCYNNCWHVTVCGIKCISVNKNLPSGQKPMCLIFKHIWEVWDFLPLYLHMHNAIFIRNVQSDRLHNVETCYLCIIWGGSDIVQSALRLMSCRRYYTCMIQSFFTSLQFLYKIYWKSTTVKYTEILCVSTKFTGLTGLPKINLKPNRRNYQSKSATWIVCFLNLTLRNKIYVAFSPKEIRI